MSIIPNRLVVVFLLLVAATPICAKEKPFAPVAEMVTQRTRHDVRWEDDLAARDESRARVRALIQQRITAGRAVQIALLNNRGLQATFEEIGISFAQLREARSFANPEAEVAVKFPDRPPTSPLYEWGVAQNFLNLVMIPLRTRVARSQLAATQLRVADEVVGLVQEVKIAYFEVLGDQQLMARLTLALAAQRSSLELTQKLHEAGNVTDLKLLQEQAQYSRLRVEFAKTQEEERRHREELNRAMGVWGADAEWRLASSEFPPVPAGDLATGDLESLAVGNRLDLAAARAELEAAIKAIGLEKRFRFIGALDFGIVGEREPDRTNLAGPSLRIELPFFNQGQARIAKGEAEVRRAAAKFEQLAVDLRSTVRELRDRLISKRDTAQFYRNELVPTRHRITQQTLLQYNAMLVGAFEAFEARKEDLDAERGMIDATRDYWITRARLERAVGGDLGAQPRRVVVKVTESKNVRAPKTRTP